MKAQIHRYPTQEWLRSNLSYDGKDFWFLPHVKNVVKTKPLRWSKAPNGYYTRSLKGVTCLQHRIVYLWHHGYLPEFIDHIDGNKANNDISNLRSCTHSQNHANIKSKSKFRGVRKRGDKFSVRIKVNQKEIYLGSYATEKEAAEVYNRHAYGFFGDFAILNEV